MRFRCSWPFPRFSRVGDPGAACSRLLGEGDVPAYVLYLQSQDSRKLSCWMDTGGPRTGGISKHGKKLFSLFSCDSDFFVRLFLPFVFVPSFPGRLWPVERPRKHVSVCPWCWEAVFASLLGILFQRQRPQQWPRNTRMSFASGQLFVFACGSASSSCSFTKRYDSFSDEPLRPFRGFRCAVRIFHLPASAVTHTLAKVGRGASKTSLFLKDQTKKEG
jgi:hypothetical protein